MFCMQLAARIRPRDLEEFFSAVGKVGVPGSADQGKEVRVFGYRGDTYLCLVPHRFGT